MKKIADLPLDCRNVNHNPPSHQVLEDGIYEHRCPGCGMVSYLFHSKATMQAPKEYR